MLRPPYSSDEPSLTVGLLPRYRLGNDCIHAPIILDTKVPAGKNQHREILDSAPCT